MNTAKWHPGKETKDWKWFLMTHRGGRGWGGKDHDCYQLEGTSQPHPRLSHGARREEARRHAPDGLVSETPLGKPGRDCWDIIWRGQWWWNTLGFFFFLSNYFTKTICSCYCISAFKDEGLAQLDLWPVWVLCWCFLEEAHSGWG